MDYLPDMLMVACALAAAAAMAALVLAVVELYHRFTRVYLATLGIDESAALASGISVSDAAIGGSMLALRRSAITFLAVLNERWVPERYLAALQLRIRKAGHPGEFKPSEIVALMQLSAFVFLLIGIAITLWLNLGFFVAPLLALLFGAVYPLIWLNDRVNARHHAITRALPYNLDLLTLSVEAGLDFAAAIGKVVEKGRKGPLADELGITLKELKLGKTREEALRNLAGRVDLSSLSTFVSALVQADKMGTPLGKILRILSTQMRVERTQRAEKLANEAPVKLLLPLIGCIFPTIFIMLFGPIAYSVFYGPQ
jgi:tight adherence protein C